MPRFFGDMTTRGPAFVEGARLEGLLQTALPYAPISLASNELVWLYELHENRDSRTWTGSVGGPYVVFASGYVPYAADAQFDLSHWDYANFALNF